MGKTSKSEKKRVADALNGSSLTRDRFRLPRDVSKEIERRDRIEWDARHAKIRLG